MNNRRAVTLVLLVVLVVGATPALAAIADYATTIEGDVPVATDQTPRAIIVAPDGSELNLVDMWEGDELNITTPEGDMRVSGDPGAEFRIHVDDIEGAQTQITGIQAGGNWIELDPADKNRVDVRGDADTLSFSHIGVNDGDTDLQVGGPAGGSAELRLHGLAGSTQYALYDPSADAVLGTLTTDGTGTGAGTVDLPDGTHALQVRTADGFAAPTLSNPDPSDEVTERPTNLSVDVGAQAFPAEVTFSLEGSQVATRTVSSNGTVTVDMSENVSDLGAYNWSAAATDGLGQTATRDVSFETPSTLTVREEHAPETLITNSSASLRFFTVDGEIAIERPITNGTVDLEGLPNSPFVVVAGSPNHYTRTIYLDSIFEQQSMYLLNETVFPRAQNEAVRSRFIYEDLTGDFPREDATIQIQRAIDLNGDGTSEYRTVTGDQWGASNEFEAILERGARYRILLVNQATGEEYVSGSHIPTEELTQTIRVSGLVAEAANASGVVGLAEYDAGNQTIDIAYSDPDGATESLQVTVETRGGDVIYTDTASDVGTYATSVALNDTEAEQDYVVRFDAGSRHQSAIPVGSGSVVLPFVVPSWLLTGLGTMAITFVGLLYGPRTAVLGAWAMVFVSAGLAMFGWGAFSAASVLVAGLIAASGTLLARVFP